MLKCFFIGIHTQIVRGDEDKKRNSFFSMSFRSHLGAVLLDQKNLLLSTSIDEPLWEFKTKTSETACNEVNMLRMT